MLDSLGSCLQTIREEHSYRWFKVSHHHTWTNNQVRSSHPLEAQARLSAWVQKTFSQVVDVGRCFGYNATRGVARNQSGNRRGEIRRQEAGKGSRGVSKRRSHRTPRDTCLSIYILKSYVGRSRAKHDPFVSLDIISAIFRRLCLSPPQTISKISRYNAPSKTVSSQSHLLTAPQSLSLPRS